MFYFMMHLANFISGYMASDESTTVGPPTVGPLTVGPPTVGPHTVGPPTVGPLTVGPLTVGPLTVGPPTVGPPTVGPPTIGPRRFVPNFLPDFAMITIGPEFVFFKFLFLIVCLPLIKLVFT